MKQAHKQSQEKRKIICDTINEYKTLDKAYTRLQEERDKALKENTSLKGQSAQIDSDDTELNKKYKQNQLDCKNAIIQTEKKMKTLKLVNKHIENIRRITTHGVV